MTSYRRMAHHPMALARATHQIRVHALETGPTYPDAIEVQLTVPESIRQAFATLDQAVRRVRIPEPAYLSEVTKPDPVLAYRSKHSSALYCMECSGAGQFGIPLTSDDLPDGGLCVSCDRDVLIVVSG
jgi:hypothetical protein